MGDQPPEKWRGFLVIIEALKGGSSLVHVEISSPAAGILKPSNIFLILAASAGAEASWQRLAAWADFLFFSLFHPARWTISTSDVTYCDSICRLSLYLDGSCFLDFLEGSIPVLNQSADQ